MEGEQMRQFGIVAFTMCCCSAIVGAGEEKTSDLDRMQGAWEIVSLVEKGTAIPADETKRLELVVAADRLTIKEEGKVVSDYKIKLDTKQKPKSLDMTITDGKDKDKTAPGIYLLDGDSLKICVDEEFKSRPAGFEEKDTKTCSVITLKRKKKE
jgi:uncharacterized protein (TIGR03067 family)